MGWALIEGLAGVVDQGRCFGQLRLSPRWAAASIDEADVAVGYEASGAQVRYVYRHAADRTTIEVSAPATAIECHVMLAANTRVESVTVNGQPVAFKNTKVEDSAYVDFTASPAGQAAIVLATRAQ